MSRRTTGGANSLTGSPQVVDVLGLVVLLWVLLAAQAAHLIIAGLGLG